MDGTIGFAVMLAVAEAALPAQWAQFREAPLDFCRIKMVQAKILQAGRINQPGAFVQTVQGGVRGGVLAGIERR